MSEELHAQLRALVAQLHATNPQQSDEQAQEYIVLCHQLADQLIPVFFQEDDEHSFKQLRGLGLTTDDMTGLVSVYKSRIELDQRALKAVNYALKRPPPWLE